MSTLLEVLDELDAGTITIESGINAQLTREVFTAPYVDIMNYQRFVPIMNYNLITKTVQTESGMNVAFVKNDIFTSDDWTVLNETET